MGGTRNRGKLTQNLVCSNQSARHSANILTAFDSRNIYLFRFYFSSLCAQLNELMIIRTMFLCCSTAQRMFDNSSFSFGWAQSRTRSSISFCVGVAFCYKFQTQIFFSPFLLSSTNFSFGIAFGKSSLTKRFLVSFLFHSVHFAFHLFGYATTWIQQFRMVNQHQMSLKRGMKKNKLASKKLEKMKKKEWWEKSHCQCARINELKPIVCSKKEKRRISNDVYIISSPISCRF